MLPRPRATVEGGGREKSDDEIDQSSPRKKKDVYDFILFLT